ncbi:MAG TPA: chromosomal replication initiator protein DnaA [Firmicutes bacterium]|nr:chromosomal replication initiator protein DnaA [Bacillota bacterium]
MPGNLSTLWSAILAEIGKEIGRPSFETWFHSTHPVSLKDHCLLVAVPNDFTREWLQNKYREIIKKKIEEVTSQDYDLQFVVSADFIDFEENSGDDDAVVPTVADTEERDAKDLSFFNPRYTFQSFVVGPCNRLSHAASLAVAQTPSKAYNPFFIYGGVGLGKTHLLHAIGQYVINHHHCNNILYCSSEKFTNDFINSIRDNKTAEFRNKYRSMEILLIDDIQFLARKEQTQEEFFHTFNTLHNLNRQIVISSDRPPKEIPTLEDRLRSRFEWGLITDIQSPDLETRIAILRKKALTEGLTIPDEVIHYIATKIENNIRELEGALIRIVAYASLFDSEVTMELTDEALKNVLFSPKKKITVEKIIEATAEHFHLKGDDICGKRRTKEIAFARQVAMYLARDLTELSLPKIGEEFGGRDHTTVLYAVRKIEDLLESEGDKKMTVDLIRNEISNSL